MWLAWDGVRWRRDATGNADRAAKQTVRQMLVAAAEIDDDDQRKHAVK